MLREPGIRQSEPLTTSVMRRLEEGGALQNALEDVIALLKSSLGCDAVAIRARRGEDFPYVASVGLPSGFLNTDSSLLVVGEDGGIRRDDHGTALLRCICGRAIRDLGTGDGNIVSSSWLASSNIRCDRAKTIDEAEIQRIPCRIEGYQSILLISFGCWGKAQGLLQVVDRRSRYFSEDRVATCENVAHAVGIAISLKGAMERLFRYNLLLEHALDVAYLYRIPPPAGFEYVSSAVTAITGYTPEEHYAEPLLPLRTIHPDDRELLLRLYMSRARNTSPVTLRWLHKSGSIVTTELHSVPIRDGKETVVAIAGIARDITDRIKAEEEVERLRSEFVAMVSHELKTPLAAIKGAAAMALGGDKTGLQDAREALQFIDQQANVLGDLIGNLLDMTRIEAGFLSVSREVVDIGALAREAVFGFSRLTRTHEVRVEAGGELPLVLADPRRTGQVLANLLNNAAKFSPIGSTILVRLAHDDCSVTIQVSDQGCGISPRKMQQLFKKFSRVHEDADRIPGTGLGLAVSKGIVDAQGGDIWAESDGEGRGSTFSFTIPVAPREASGESKEEQRVAPARTVRVAGPRPRILAVDDQPGLLRYLQRHLEQAGFEVEVTTEARKLLGQMQRRDPDLILLDLVLPGVSGFTLLDQIRQSSCAPVIVLTASQSQEDAVKALKMGADDYVTKPFAPAELCARIDAVLRRRAAADPSKVKAPVVVNGLTVNFAERRVTRDGLELTLSATEYRLIQELALNAGRVLMHDQLLARVWGPAYVGCNELLRGYIRYLRHKLGDDARHPCFILTHRRLGYSFINSNPFSQ